MGNETINRWLILGTLLAVTLYLVWNAPEQNYDANIVQAVKPNYQSRQDDLASKSLTNKTETAIPLLPRGALNQAETVDLFGTQTMNTTPVIVKQLEPRKEPVTAHVPPLPFTYIGKMVEGSVIKVFLLEDQSLHILSKGDKVGDRYQLQQVNEQQLSWLYLPMNITQKMNIGKAP